MRELLRSLFVADKGADDEALLLRNYQAFNGSGLGFDVSEYNALWQFTRDFVRAHNHVPDVTTLRSHFKQAKEDSVLDQLERLVALPALTKGDFVTALEAKSMERKQRQWSETLKTAAIIASQGMEVKDENGTRFLQGPIHSARYVNEHTHDIVAPTIGGRLSGEVTSDGVAAKEEYERVESDPLAGIGQFCFIKQIDDALAGAKRQELWIHAAFTGGMKSTYMLNWAYNQAVIYKHSVLIFSLEMPYQQCRRILYAMHSAHPKFREIRMQLGLQKDINQDVGIPYGDIRDGTLNDYHVNAKRFYFDYVIPDFNGKNVVNHPYFDCDYAKIHIEVSDPDKDDFTMNDLRSRAEVIYSESPYSLLFVDHCGLMSPRRFRKSTTENLNEVIRDLKKLALGFNRGQGMAVVGLFQISREGYKAALKAKEKGGTPGYNLTHLSYANECIVEGTLIPTKGGLVPVESISVGNRVVDSKGGKTVSHVFDQGVRPLWKTVTDRGSELLTTADHEVRVVGESGLFWKQVSDLESGDFVVGRLGGLALEGAADLPSFEVGPYEKASGQQGVPLTTPDHMTPDLAYLLGAWDGDGHVHPKGLAWTGNRNEQEVKRHIRQAFLKVFNHSLPQQESPSRPGSFDLLKWSQPLKRWFEGVAGARAGEVPDAVLRSPSCYAAYLKGLFDTDGWVNKAGTVGIKMKASSETFLRQVQMMMQVCGIETSLSFSSGTLKKTGKTYRNVTLRVRSRRGRERFAALIGFTEFAKQKTLMDFVEAGSKSDRRGDVQMYPIPHTFLSAYGKVRPAGTPREGFTPGFCDAPRKVEMTGMVSRGNIVKLLRHARAGNVWGPDFEYMRSLVEDLLVMQVVSVEDTGREAPVWDLEVGGDYEYQTGPLLSHNCERSADIVTTTWIDDELKNQSRVQFQCLKSRDQKPFDPCVARVEWPCRRLYSCFEAPMSAAEAMQKGDAIDKADAELDA